MHASCIASVAWPLFQLREDFKQSFELHQMILSSLHAELDPPSQQHDAPHIKASFRFGPRLSKPCREYRIPAEQEGSYAEATESHSLLYKASLHSSLQYSRCRVSACCGSCSSACWIRDDAKEGLVVRIMSSSKIAIHRCLSQVESAARRKSR